MSIQQIREDIARTQTKALAANPNFVKKVSAQADRYDASQAHAADWRRLRGDLVGALKALGEKGEFTDSDQALFDNIEARIRYCDAKIDLMAFAEKRGLHQGAPSSGWIDAKTKEPIRAYKPGESIAAERGGSEVSVGALLEGMLFGPRNGEVKAALEGGTGAAGGFTVPIEIVREFWDLLRARSVFVQAGAVTVPLMGPTRMCSSPSSKRR